MHVPVLAGPALEWLRVRRGGTYVDCTAGLGGHAALIAEALDRLEGAPPPSASDTSFQGRLIALDRDVAAVEASRSRLARFSFATVVHRNYSELRAVLAEWGVAEVDGILLDAGVSSDQLDDPARGFSFQREGPLDMRMDTTQGCTAATLLATMREEDLAHVLRTYGDIRPARRVAQSILRRRDRGALHSTNDLAGAVADAFHFVQGVPEETRTVFQAIRMAVNDELACLESGLSQALDALAPGARLVVIAFHSGEDRVMKRALREAARPRQELYPDGRVKRVTPPLVKLLTRKPVLPSQEETRQNPRASSGRLRAVERLPAA